MNVLEFIGEILWRQLGQCPRHIFGVIDKKRHCRQLCHCKLSGRIGQNPLRDIHDAAGHLFILAHRIGKAAAAHIAFDLDSVT